MTDYEKGSPAWDIGQIMTRHETVGRPCAKVLNLRLTAMCGIPSDIRLAKAHEASCTCGAGYSDSEHTTEAKERNPWFQQNRGGSTSAQQDALPTG